MIFANVMDDGKGTRLAYLYPSEAKANAAAKRSVVPSTRAVWLEPGDVAAITREEQGAAATLALSTVPFVGGEAEAFTTAFMKDPG